MHGVRLESRGEQQGIKIGPQDALRFGVADERDWRSSLGLRRRAGEGDPEDRKRGKQSAEERTQERIGELHRHILRQLYSPPHWTVGLARWPVNGENLEALATG